MIEDDKKRGDSGIILNIWLTETASGRLVSSRTIERMYVVVSTFKRTSSFKINQGWAKFLDIADRRSKTFEINPRVLSLDTRERD